MLKPELAQERLKEFEVKESAERRRDRVGELPPGLRGVGFPLLRRDAKGKEVAYDESGAAYAAALNQIPGLSTADRTKLFEALFPRLGAQAETTWQFWQTQPYQTGWSRRAFHAPESPAVINIARKHWLEQMLWVTRGYEMDAEWFAIWAPYLGYGRQDELGVLFAALIDTGGPEGEAIFQLLMASASGEHPIGTIGRHVTRALFAASRREGWELLERMLIAAQRQEGLRQVILETVDCAHPEAFRRMLHLILDHGLARFSATARALDTWLGMQWMAENTRVIEDSVRTVLGFLERPETREPALAGPDAGAAYLAVWTMAYENAARAVGPTAALLQDSAVEKRFAGAFLLVQLGLRTSQDALLPALEDADLRVAILAHQVFTSAPERLHDTDLFERIERLLARLPAKDRDLDPILWPWTRITTSRAQVADSLSRCLGKRAPRRLIPYLSQMQTHTRAQVVAMLEKREEWDAEVRDAIFALVGDTAANVREAAIQAMRKCILTDEETRSLERLFTRKAGDLRRAILALLLKSDDAQVLASAGRLIESSNVLQRSAGLELLREMVDAGRRTEECRELARQRRRGRAAVSPEEEPLLQALLDKDRETPTLENALGLMDPTRRTPANPPKPVRGCLLVTPAASECLKALDSLVREYREETVELPYYAAEGMTRTELLGNIRWGFPRPDPTRSLEEDLERLPLRSVWERWLRDRGSSFRDPDGFELIRAMQPHLTHEVVAIPEKTIPVSPDRKDLFLQSPRMEYGQIVLAVLPWLIRMHSPSGAVDFLLDAVQTSFADFVGKGEWRGGRNRSWLTVARAHSKLCPEEWEDRHHARFWHLLRWMDEPVSEPPPLRRALKWMFEPPPDLPRLRPELGEALAALRAGAAVPEDLYDLLLGTRVVTRNRWDSGADFTALRELTGRKIHPHLVEYPALREIVNRCRERIVEVELRRGDMPTAASAPALILRSLEGTNTLLKLVAAFGKEGFVRGYAYDNLSRASVFSHLIRSTFPGEADTPDTFGRELKAASLPTKRIVEVGVYAPQWARHIEAAIGWPGFAEAVWWVHAHTKDTQWTVDAQIREAWAAETAERTPLSAQSLLDGAVDVAWFHRCYSALGAERWAAVDDAAKFASGGGGHKRAQLFASAMLGTAPRDTLLVNIREKRAQDSVRALGLLPLKAAPDDPLDEEELLERYRVIQEFARTSSQFGSQRQASEKLAASIALENLARTAGYPDPARLEWAMETRAVADLAAGSVTVRVGDTAASLSIDPMGKPQLSYEKGGKPAKSIPPALRKDPAVVQLQTRKKELDRQRSRMRDSLENAMCRGDRFTGRELRNLFRHPVLAPMIRNLALVSEEGAGYPVDDGAALETPDGPLRPLREEATVQIAHPYDLLQTGEWDKWQRECFIRERVQPFKQVFRELYVLTASEQDEGVFSRRYAGHQVNPRQAVAVLGKRGWVCHPEEGLRRTFHDAGLSAWITFEQGFFTPTEVEGLTVEAVAFSRRGEWQPLKLEELPARLFSEVMRDLDLMVSVAHQGGVDPEATASTVEMRAALIRESCRLLKLENVRLQKTHVLVDGVLGTYSIHLGSAVVHRQPGGHLCIVPVHAQHRGRLFLPFADDDPRTAEVLSKVVLLSNDREIKDPTILEQILA